MFPITKRKKKRMKRWKGRKGKKEVYVVPSRGVNASTRIHVNSPMTSRELQTLDGVQRKREGNDKLDKRSADNKRLHDPPPSRAPEKKLPDAYDGRSSCGKRLAEIECKRSESRFSDQVRDVGVRDKRLEHKENRDKLASERRSSRHESERDRDGNREEMKISRDTRKERDGERDIEKRKSRDGDREKQSFQTRDSTSQMMITVYLDMTRVIIDHVGRTVVAPGRFDPFTHWICSFVKLHLDFKVEIMRRLHDNSSLLVLSFVHRCSHGSTENLMCFCKGTSTSWMDVLRPSFKNT